MVPPRFMLSHRIFEITIPRIRVFETGLKEQAWNSTLDYWETFAS